MTIQYKKYTIFKPNLFIIGFGTIGQAILPLIFRHIEIEPEQIFILTKKEEGEAIAKEFRVHFQLITVQKIIIKRY